VKGKNENREGKYQQNDQSKEKMSRSKYCRFTGGGKINFGKERHCGFWTPDIYYVVMQGAVLPV
jgi:hypothetical protein